MQNIWVVAQQYKELQLNMDAQSREIEAGSEMNCLAPQIETFNANLSSATGCNISMGIKGHIYIHAEKLSMSNFQRVSFLQLLHNFRIVNKEDTDKGNYNA